MSEQKNCKTCKHSRWTLTSTGRIKRDESGRCAVDVVMPIIPFCARSVSLSKYAIWPHDGEGCPLYVANGDKPQAIDGMEPGYR